MNAIAHPVSTRKPPHKRNNLTLRPLDNLTEDVLQCRPIDLLTQIGAADG